MRLKSDKSQELMNDFRKLGFYTSLPIWSMQIRSVIMEQTPTLKELQLFQRAIDTYCIVFPDTDVTYDLNVGLVKLLAEFHTHIMDFYLICAMNGTGVTNSPHQARNQRRRVSRLGCSMKTTPPKSPKVALFCSTNSRPDPVVFAAELAFLWLRGSQTRAATLPLPTACPNSDLLCALIGCPFSYVAACQF
ncbi:hypothetical protein CCACVL1_29085 [Corchorus capsularis]|uniref:Uncharacterized protein n=1 Tax=Corchorus capsularis TaxID=210143 RepID=A0A1R3G3Y7_COCAP|nr:hypothetical protein CCACVL1_29085 [Corchorus capsularis]